MGKVIAIANHKGGVAKTTTALNLGGAFVQLGKKALLVDVDPQCNLTETVCPGEHEDTVFTAILDGVPMKPVAIREGFDIIPGDKGLLSADVVLSSEPYKNRAQVLLRDGLKPFKALYDFIIIDCPPSRNIITVNALVAADEVIVPTLSEILAVRGMKDMSNLVDLVRGSLNPGLRIAGLLLTQFGDRTIAARKTVVYIEEIARFLNTKLFRTRIRKNVAVVESQMAGTDVFSDNPSAKAAQDYMALAKEYLEIS